MAANYRLSDACSSTIYIAQRIEPIYKRIEEVSNSLMLVTALNTKIAIIKREIAQTAHKNGTTLKEETVRLGYVSPEDFDNWVKPEEMV
jgi:fumarate hydratase class II